MATDASTMRLVETAKTEPTAPELERKKAEVLARLRSITPDQIKGFVSRSADKDVAGEAKLMWEKTIWEK